MSDAIRLTASISADQYQITDDQRVSMEADRFPVFGDVITPLQLAGGFIKCIEHPRTGTNEDRITCDRRNGEHSTASLEFPDFSR
jgi:hypothetical protein